MILAQYKAYFLASSVWLVVQAPLVADNLDAIDDFIEAPLDENAPTTWHVIVVPTYIMCSVLVLAVLAQCTRLAVGTAILEDIDDDDLVDEVDIVDRQPQRNSFDRPVPRGVLARETPGPTNEFVYQTDEGYERALKLHRRRMRTCPAMVAAFIVVCLVLSSTILFGERANTATGELLAASLPPAPTPAPTTNVTMATAWHSRTLSDHIQKQLQRLQSLISIDPDHVPWIVVFAPIIAAFFFLFASTAAHQLRSAYMARRYMSHVDWMDWLDYGLCPLAESAPPSALYYTYNTVTGRRLTKVSRQAPPFEHQARCWRADLRTRVSIATATLMVLGWLVLALAVLCAALAGDGRVATPLLPAALVWAWQFVFVVVLAVAVCDLTRERHSTFSFFLATVMLLSVVLLALWVALVVLVVLEGRNSLGGSWHFAFAPAYALFSLWLIWLATICACWRKRWRHTHMRVAVDDGGGGGDTSAADDPSASEGEERDASTGTDVSGDESVDQPLRKISRRTSRR